MYYMQRLDPTELAQVIHHLNYRWGYQTLSLWQGIRAPFHPQAIYAGFERLLNPETIASMDRLDEPLGRNRIRHGLIDHYLQRTLLPHETEMQAWSRGAVALVEKERIGFRELIPWCQKASTWKKRRILQKETSALCKFLKPFALDHWRMVLETIQGELGYADYVAYCGHKKGVDYDAWVPMVKDLLRDSDGIYRKAMDPWSQRRFGQPMERLNRFDAICLLGMGEFDASYPVKDIAVQLDFLATWGLSAGSLPGLNLDIRRNGSKSAQALTILLQVPEEVYVLMRPEGGWIDLETLWHELGHGLSASLTRSDLSLVEGDLATSFALSEAFAFLLQDMALSRSFLERILGLSAREAAKVAHHKTVKDIAAMRRYGAKFLAEYAMFKGSALSDGQPYADTMARFTGFYHQPESHLFDLVPELYCMDYLLGWMGAASLRRHLEQKLGETWYLQPEAGDILKAWWAQGNRRSYDEFFDVNGLERPSPRLLLDHLKASLIQSAPPQTTTT